MTYKVFVDGQEGTTGLQINEYLAKRGDIEVLAIDPAKRKDVAERRRLLNASDVSFLCLPDDAAREAVALVDNAHTCVIDASTAHRIDPAWTFGLPEMAREQRARIRASKRIANPGCHASAFILALRPLVTCGLLPANTPVAANSITGYSGGGKKLIEQYRGAQCSTAPRPYALGLTHKHLPEMCAYTGLRVAPIFQPIVGPFYKGLAVTAYLHPGQFTRRPTRTGSSPITTPVKPSSAWRRSTSRRIPKAASSTSRRTTTATVSTFSSSATRSACSSSPAWTTSARALPERRCSR